MKKRFFTMIELMAVIVVLVILMSLAMTMVNQVKARAIKAAALNDAVQLKNAIINFVGENQRFPRIGASDDKILTIDEYQSLISILRGESNNDNRRRKVYLSKARLNFNESASQYKCQLVGQFRDKEANFWVILDLSDNGIDLGNGKTLNESVLIFGGDSTKVTAIGGNLANSIDWTKVAKDGVMSSPF